MKRWPLSPFVLLILFAVLPASLAMPTAATETRQVGEVVDRTRANFAERCRADVGAQAMDAGTDCHCAPQMLDAAFPPSLLARRVTKAWFTARLSGPTRICLARASRQDIAAGCAHGGDPFAAPGEKPAPARAAARCACLKADIGKAADADFAKAADAATARYEAALAAGQPWHEPDPAEVLKDADSHCRAVKAPAR